MSNGQRIALVRIMFGDPPVRPPIKQAEKRPSRPVIPAADDNDAAYEQFESVFDHAMEHREWKTCSECQRWLRFKRIALEIFR